MEYKEILSDLEKKIYHPIYILHGEEPYYIDIICNYIEKNVLTDEEKDFNQTVVYGKDTSAEAINALARRYPMMSDYQVVIVKEAQNVKDLADLKFYAENPLKSTILVLCHKYKKIDGKLSLIKTVQKNGCVLTSDKVPDYNLDKWIENFLKEQNIGYETNIPKLLADYLGNDLQRIANEIDKLQKAVPNLKKITADIVEKNIGISKQFNDFELQDAFGDRDTVKVFRILKVYEKNPKDNPPQRTIPILFNFFKNLFLMYYMPGKSDAEVASTLKINPYLVKIKYRTAMRNYTAMKLFKIISLLREYDMKTKGVDSGSTSSSELMRELAIKILA
ncbi:MAG: DNA polymerase III subunit delta [Bacteroidales bacterium]|nr:DNA polymerase III subunit delta [Bacteroidales bacterium]